MLQSSRALYKNMAATVSQLGYVWPDLYPPWWLP